MNAQEVYEFHQTPVALAQALIPLVPLEPHDTLYEAFRGQGAFYNNFPEGHPKDWSEITEGRDYKDYTGEYDWIITNPPYRLETNEEQKDNAFRRVNAFWILLDHFSQRARKGIAMLVNDRCIVSLTPLRIKKLEDRGFFIESLKVCNVKRWRGRYFFIILRKGAKPCMTGILGSF
jgi:hypothetical protein